jgi:DNA-binding CsgD family transcriptional regulator
VAVGEGIVGRHEELAALRAFLTAPFPAALVIEGEAGIGKTALWRTGTAEAAARGFRVISASPPEGETKLSFAVLRDLLDDVFDTFGAGLTAPQRTALACALLREDARQPPEPSVIAAATLSTVRLAAGDSPLVLAVDDVQWLDPPSREALEFTVRRLQDEQVGLLIARRGDGSAPVPLALDRAPAGEHLHAQRLGPLSIGAIHQMIGDRLGTTLPRPILARIHEASGGNPFFALELARAIERRGSQLAAGQPLPVPDNVTELIRERLAGLPETTREALLAAAALSSPNAGLVGEVTGRDPWPDLRRAVENELVELDEERIRFTHPLLSAAVYGSVDLGRRRELHGRLAQIVPDLEERARHVAIAAEPPDDEAAALLDGAAERAATRGAPAAAAELIEFAIRLTSDDDSTGRDRRRLRAADLHAAAGSRHRSEALLAELEREAEGPDRARALLRQAQYQALPAAIALYEAALPDAAGYPELEGELEHFLGYDLALTGDLAAGRAHVRRAVQLLDAAEGPALAEVLAGHALLEMYAGEPVPDQLLVRAIDLERRIGGAPQWRSPTKIAAVRLVREGRLDAARPLLEEFGTRAVAYGDESLHVNALRLKVELECRAGRFDVAEALVDELSALAEQIGEPLETLHPAALVAAYRAPSDEARALAFELKKVAVERDIAWEVITAESLLGFIELSEGDAAAAWRVLKPLPATLEAIGYRDIGGLPPLHVHAVEAAVAVGELGFAHDLTALLEDRAAQIDSPWARMSAARTVGLVAAARGENDEAFAAFARALEEEARAPAPFERARMLLAFGAAQRRAKQWAEARRSFDEAVAIFGELGTSVWLDRARAELARVPGRAPARGTLTATERRVAGLVAQGRSNKEVAAALFVTVKAVEANLSRVYAKLGVRSRSELAHRFTDAAELENL